LICSLIKPVIFFFLGGMSNLFQLWADAVGDDPVAVLVSVETSGVSDGVLQGVAGVTAWLLG
jgi:hypothetical protein